MVSKIIISFIFVLFGVHVFCNDDAWSEFKVNFNKKYDHLVEEIERKKIFEDNLLKIKYNNKKYAEGLVSYKLAINKFADLKPGELSAKHYTGFLPLQNPRFKSTKETADNNLECSRDAIDHISNIPESIDWRKKGAVTDVKEQGSCGSSWVFSATGVIEGQMAKKTGKLVSLTEQQLVDCETEMSSGCSRSGSVVGAFFYARDNGLMTGQDYPYKAIQSHCKASSTDKSNRVFVNDCYAIEPNSEDNLKARIGLIGPISVAIRMDSIALYKKGIYNDSCTGDLNQAVLVVGYGKDKKTGDEYWIVKNSWGLEWGEDGYIRLKMGNNTCGITEKPFYATYDEQRSTSSNKIFELIVPLLGIIISIVIILILKSFYEKNLTSLATVMNKND